MVDDKELWLTYKKTGNLQAREDLIVKYIPLVKYVVGKMVTGLPNHIEFEDLVEYGIIGLLDAVNKYDVSKGINFKTYAVTRIRGSIYDELRSQDWVPRSVRKLAKDIEKAFIELEFKNGESPTEEQIANFLEIDVDKIHEVYAKVNMGNINSLDDLVYDGGESKTTLSNMVEDKTVESPQDNLEMNELKKELVNLLDSLKEKERLVITLYYYEKLTLKEIGKVLDISESRVSQIHSKTILKLRSKLVAKFGDYAENIF